MTEPILFTFAAASGFVVAAVSWLPAISLWLIRPARFEIVRDVGTCVDSWAHLLRVGLVVWAAPYIIMRNAVRGRLIERRPLGWLLASFAIAGVWSLCAGILVIYLAVVIA